MPDGAKPGDPHPPPRGPAVQEISGDTFFLMLTSPPPIIPDGQGRNCPQCNSVTWLNSRFCWHCRYDFDRASIKRLHPSKMLCFSAAANVGFLAYLLARALG